MKFPEMPEALYRERLRPPQGRVRIVLDTDTYNEIDDQFAHVYALLSPEKAELEAIYAAPFHNRRSESPRDGMEKSLREILRVLDRMGLPADGLVHRGAPAFLEGPDQPAASPAAEDLVRRAMRSKGPLYAVPSAR